MAISGLLGAKRNREINLREWDDQRESKHLGVAWTPVEILLKGLLHGTLRNRKVANDFALIVKLNNCGKSGQRFCDVIRLESLTASTSLFF